MKKDHRGAQLIRLLSVPQADGTFREDPALMAEMVAYCEQDVRAMRSISKALRPLSESELLDYHVNECINDRGVLVDVPLCNAAVKFASDELTEIEQIVAEVTEGAITSVRSPKMRQWVIDRVGPQALKLMKTGEKYSIDKTVRANLLAMENPDEIPPAVAEVIQCADDLWASSVAKFSRLASLADVEDLRQVELQATEPKFIISLGDVPNSPKTLELQWSEAIQLFHNLESALLMSSKECSGPH
jgi:DNA polymerase